jgi:glycosyltransferase involved in cell wall biosynthesis
METLRFLMVSTHFPPQHLGGDAVFVEYLSRELIRRGHEVHVFHSPASYELLRDARPIVPDETADGGLKRHPYFSKLGRFYPVIELSLGFWGAAENRLKELTRDLKPDVVHWHNTKGFIGRPFASDGALCLYTAHDYTTVCPRSNLLRADMSICQTPKLCTVCHLKWRKPPQLWRAGKRRRVVSIPEQMKVLSVSDFVATRLGQDGIRVHKVIRGFVPDRGGNIRRDSSSPDTIVYLGLLEYHKGVLQLLDSFSKTRDEQGFRLAIIGEGTLKGELKRRIERHGLSDRVSIPGFIGREEVEATRRNAAVQIVPSVWYENAPSVILEAYSLGLPVLASDIGGLPEIVGPDSGSLLFPMGDVDRLARLMVDAWLTRDSLNDRRRMARRAYETRFSPDTHLNQYLRTISDLVR